MGDRSSPKAGRLARLTDDTHFLANELSQTLSAQLGRRVTIGEVIRDALVRFRDAVASKLDERAA